MWATVVQGPQVAALCGSCIGYEPELLQRHFRPGTLNLGGLAQNIIRASFAKYRQMPEPHRGAFELEALGLDLTVYGLSSPDTNSFLPPISRLRATLQGLPLPPHLSYLQPACHCSACGGHLAALYFWPFIIIDSLSDLPIIFHVTELISPQVFSRIFCILKWTLMYPKRLFSFVFKFPSLSHHKLCLTAMCIC